MLIWIYIYTHNYTPYIYIYIHKLSISMCICNYWRARVGGTWMLMIFSKKWWLMMAPKVPKIIYLWEGLIGYLYFITLPWHTVASRCHMSLIFLSWLAATFAHSIFCEHIGTQLTIINIQLLQVLRNCCNCLTWWTFLPEPEVLSSGPGAPFFRCSTLCGSQEKWKTYQMLIVVACSCKSESVF